MLPSCKVLTDGSMKERAKSVNTSMADHAIRVTPSIEKAEGELEERDCVMVLLPVPLVADIGGSRKRGKGKKQNKYLLSHYKRALTR